MSEHSVAVVIATRDRPEMVREAISSVLTQEHEGQLEVVVVFDQSAPDSTLARDDGDRRVIVTTNSNLAGLAGARNTGIAATSAEFVAFLDDDDLWLPGKLAAQMAAMERNPEALLCCCGIQVEYDGETHDRSLASERITHEDLLRDRHTELHPSTFLFRTDKLRETVVGVDQAVPGGFGEDYDLLLRSAFVSPLINVTRPLVVVRWGGQSFFFQRWQTMADGLTWLLDRHPGFAYEGRGRARIQGQVAFAHASMGDWRQAVRWSGRAIGSHPLEPRVPLAMAVAMRLVSPGRVMTTLHQRGKGI